MWLIQCETLSLRFFQKAPKEGYAILSHTWEEDEVSFHEFQNPTPEIRGRAGFRKIENCCRQARRDGNVYAWVDTCCIDKSSSAELSEAINSMFQWYREATVCYAYLATLKPSTDPSEASLGKYRWFQRGWTLQELIALSYIFFDENWNEIGSKSSLRHNISSITGIPEDVLSNSNAGKEYSVAQIMSWAARRQTTRVEDSAYSLLGLFGVHMPMIYGEGRHAFIRLQHEIIKKTKDESIFAWTRHNDGTVDTSSSSIGSGLFAESPEDFNQWGDIMRYQLPQDGEYSITNKGLRIQLPLVSLDEPREYGAILACGREDEFIGVCLQYQGDFEYTRIRPGKLLTFSLGYPIPPVTVAYVREPDSSNSAWTRAPLYCIQIDFRYFGNLEAHGYTATESHPSDNPSVSQHGAFSFSFPNLDDSCSDVGIILQGRVPENKFAVVAGRGLHGVWADIETNIRPGEGLFQLLNTFSSSFKDTTSTNVPPEDSLTLERRAAAKASGQSWITRRLYRGGGLKIKVTVRPTGGSFLKQEVELLTRLFLVRIEVVS